MAPRKKFYNRKQYWKHKHRALDQKVMGMVTAEARLRLSPMSDYFTAGYDVQSLGELTADLFKQATTLGLSGRLLDELRDGDTLLELFSARLQKVVEEKWGAALPTFPQYLSRFRASGELSLLPWLKVEQQP